ncbi:MAG TPA: hypothetical protein GXZ56_00720 [Bacteroidales bacterium]|jgi:ABC-type branched-subunit amino acid transport system substrate-binding protein|nr:hypothetical protein [Bacteroidales bacterium]
MRNKVWLVFACIIPGLITGCHDDTGMPGAETVSYKVAVIMPLSSGNDWNRTIDWALDNFRQAQVGLPKITEIQVELKNEEDADLAEYLSRVASDDTYTAIIGPYSSRNARLAAIACVAEQKTLILPLATSTEFQRIFAGKECIWNLAQSDLTQCEILLMQMAVSDMPSVSLLTADDDYGKSFSDWFAYQAIELGLEVEDMVIYRNNEELKNGVAHFADKRFRSGALLFAPSKASDFQLFDETYDQLDRGSFPMVYCSDVAHSKTLVGKIKHTYEGVSPSADPASGFVNAYRSKFGESPVAGEAHLFDAISLLGYALAAFGDADLNGAIKNIVDGRDNWNRGWMASDMQAALLRLQAGGFPNLSGVSGDWTFDQKHYASVLNSSYCHWVLKNGEYHTLEYLSTDGSGRTISMLQTWQTQAEQFQQFNQRQEDFNYGKHEGNWAVVIGTSDTWANYRHQADAMAMYQILKRHGYDDDHIVLIIADNIAYDSRNLYPGVVKVKPDGENLYRDMKVDYKINDVTIADLQDIFLGNSSKRLPHVIAPGKNDNIIVFWCGHGNHNRLAWGSHGTVYGTQVRDILRAMHEEQRYRKILFAMDACYSGSIGEACIGIPGVLFITAANAYETSKADMKDPEMGIWLSNGFTRAFQEAIDETPNITMRDLYYKLARQTVGSHATVYNAEYYGNMYSNTMKEYLN